jgi:hypothetical protein
MPEIRAMGFAWYTPAGWYRLREVADDLDGQTYLEFVTKAERIIAEFAAQGIRAEKVVIDVDDLVAWCRREGCKNDQKARAAYGAHLMCLRDMKPEGGLQ